MAGETVVAEPGGQPTSDPSAGASAAAEASTTPSAVDTSASGQGQPDPAAQDQGGQDPDIDALIMSDEEFEKLQDDPGEALRRLRKAYTQKTQGLAPATRLWAAIQKNPDFVLESLAKARGVTIVKPQQQTQQEEKDAEVELLTKLTDAIGEDAAKAFLPTVKEMIASEVDNKTKTYRESGEEAERQAQIQAAERVEAEFTQKYPDWKKHEKQMIALAHHLQPDGLSPYQFMELLYRAVNTDAVVASAVNDHQRQQQKAARAIAESAVSGQPNAPAESAPAGGGQSSLRDILRESMDEVKSGKRK